MRNAYAQATLARTIVTNLSPQGCLRLEKWLRGGDLNPRPLGYEPNELPDCSTPRQEEIHIITRPFTPSSPRERRYERWPLLRLRAVEEALECNLTCPTRMIVS